MPFAQGAWFGRDVSEIKPGSFSHVRQLEKEYDSLRCETVQDKAQEEFRQASVDKYHKYVKHLVNGAKK